MSKITLVLGSGGARGACFVGVLRALRGANIEVGRVIGCSMGALIGAAYCCGRDLEEIEERLCRLRLRHFLRPNPRMTGLFSHGGVRRIARSLIDRDRFEDLVTPLSVVCTDLNSGRRVVLDEGNLLEPVVGSCLAAGFFQPVQYRGWFLVDGGYLDPVAVDVAPEEECVVAVDPSLTPEYDIGLAAGGRRFFGGPVRIWRQLLKGSDMVFYSLAAAQKGLRPHVRITPEFTGEPFCSFRETRRLVQLGEDAAVARVGEIRRLLAEHPATGAR